MTALNLLKTWLNENALPGWSMPDQEGAVRGTLSSGLIINLEADDSDYVYAWIDLMSLQASGAETVKTVLWLAAEANMPGILPAGLRLAASEEAGTVILTGQFEAAKLDKSAFQSALAEMDYEGSRLAAQIEEAVRDISPGSSDEAENDEVLTWYLNELMGQAPSGLYEGGSDRPELLNDKDDLLRPQFQAPIRG
ncbi:hypothetical protein C4J81_17735 [Deltaproteobacteria bacterium Smac51]|nr:hypothetical protein C4J81_17735 [Deltaproteobacteria bacterium Smac51]